MSGNVAVNINGAGESSSSRRGGGGNGGGLVNDLINNSGERPHAPRDTTPLLAGGAHASGDFPHHGRHQEDKGGRLHLKGVTWLVAVAVVVAALLFGLLALHHAKTDTVPFAHVTHPLQPTALWGAVRRPYPTGAWWTNLVLGQGDNNVGMLPYAIKATEANGVEVSYSHFRHMGTDLVQADLWAADMSLSSVENVTARYVESYDPLSVGLVFPTVAHLQHNRPSYYRTHLVRDDAVCVREREREREG